MVEVDAILSVAVADAVPVTVALVLVQVGAEIAPVGPETTQLRLTAPVKPPNGVTVIVALVDAPGLASVKLLGPVRPIF